MSDPNGSNVVRGEVIPPESRELRMPNGTPLGMGILGAMRFDAIRRVLEHYERALRSAITANDAEAERNNSLVRRAVSHEQLANLDIIRGAERKRILTAAQRIDEEEQIASLQRTLQRLELEAKIAEKQGQLARVKAKYGDSTDETPTKDDYSELIDELKRMPDIAEALVATKADIIKRFGGEEKLGEDGEQLIESLNALINATIQKRAEGRVF